MKTLKKLSLLLVAFLCMVSLASCQEPEVRNTSVPTADLNSSAVIATSGDYSVTNDIFYAKLRANGYTTVLNKIKSTLFSSELEYVKGQINLGDATVNDYEQDLFDVYASDVFGTSSADSIEAFDEDELTTLFEKLIDKYNNRGILLTKEDIKYSIENDKVKFTYIPQEIIDEALINIAVRKAAKDALEKIVDSERIEDDEKKLVTNSNYISPANLKSYYESNTKTYGTYRAIIIQFNNLNEARNAIAAVENELGPLNDANALTFYAKLYNTYYNYRSQLELTDPFANSNDSSKNVFEVTEDKDELTSISSSVKNLVTTTLDEDGQYIKEPFNQNNKYVMVYRGKTEFDINKRFGISDNNEVIEWDDLEAKNAEEFIKLKAEIREKLIDNKVSSYTTTILSKRIKAADIEVYDPFFEFKFKGDYDKEYELIDPSKFDNNNIFKIAVTNSESSTQETYTYSVQDFYNDQTKLSGLTIVVDQLVLDYVYDLKDKFLDSDKINDLDAELDKSISSFEKNENTAYPSAVGLELYLLANFGYTNRDDVYKYNKLAENAKTAYLNQRVFDEWAVKDADGNYTHEINYDKLNILQNILDAGNKNKENLFSINIDHLLIYIDDDGDGSPDDPKDFLKNIDDKDKFYEALLQLSRAIYKEANCEELTKSNDLMEILNYIVTAYNKNAPLFSEEGVTWAKYKNYNFLLKVESLSSGGDTTQSNVGNYVKEFGDYVKKLYTKVSENKVSIDKDKPIFYFVNSLDKSPETMDDICSTEFGYHMIVVNSYEEQGTTKNTSSSDTNGYQKNIQILLNEMDKDTTEDNIYVVVPDTYNEDGKEATMNQLFTFYVQQQNGATSTFDSTLRDVLSAMFSESITRYTSAGFQNFLLFQELNIIIADGNSLMAKQLENYEGYLIRTSQSYDKEDKFSSWYNGTLNWARPYSD